MLGIKIPQIKLEKTFLELNKNRTLIALTEMGLNERSNFNLTEFLYHKTVDYSRIPEMTSVNKRGLYPGLIGMTRSLDRLRKQALFKIIDRVNIGVGLFFVANQNTMQVYYVLPKGSGIQGPVFLSVTGGGMERMKVLPLRERKEERERQGTHYSNPNRCDLNDFQFNDEEWRRKFDRLAGGISGGNLQEGFRLLEKARNSRFFVLGAGRAGSWIAHRMAKEGFGAIGGLFIADPDKVGVENLEGMLVPAKAVGMNKAQAVASTIAMMIPGARPIPIDAGLSSEKAVDILRTCDVLITAVDEDAWRFASAVIASRYHLVHIDFSGGSSWIGKDKAVTGGELRIFIPGSYGCLACMGNYNMQEVERLLNLTDEQELDRRAKINWKKQRPGSNVDVLMPLIGEALQSLWGILRGEIRESRWLHYEKNAKGMPVWQDWTRNQQSRACPVCLKQSGLGDLA